MFLEIVAWCVRMTGYVNELEPFSWLSQNIIEISFLALFQSFHAIGSSRWLVIIIPRDGRSPYFGQAGNNSPSWAWMREAFRAELEPMLLDHIEAYNSLIKVVLHISDSSRKVGTLNYIPRVGNDSYIFSLCLDGHPPRCASPKSSSINFKISHALSISKY